LFKFDALVFLCHDEVSFLIYLFPKNFPQNLCPAFFFSFSHPLLKMYAKLLPLISKVLFYELNVGVDIKVANQQRILTFPNSKNTPNIAAQASRLLNSSLYIHLKTHPTPGSPTTESLNYEPSHFILTSAWLILGGLCKSFLVIKHIPSQSYIPFIWKVAIILSSFFLMGPLFIYFFAIFIILTSSAHDCEKKRILLLVGSTIKQMNL
jgi:hypothetical protein